MNALGRWLDTRRTDRRVEGELDEHPPLGARLDPGPRPRHGDAGAEIGQA